MIQQILAKDRIALACVSQQYPYETVVVVAQIIRQPAEQHHQQWIRQIVVSDGLKARPLTSGSSARAFCLPPCGQDAFSMKAYRIGQPFGGLLDQILLPHFGADV